VPGGEQGQYTFWDPENWAKERKEMTVLYADLEEKNVPAFVAGPGLVLSQGTAGQGQAAGQQQPQQQQQQSQQLQQGQVGQVQQSQVQSSQRGSFQMSIAGL
jgi:CCR4-NOT transcription complex subunit 2